MSPDPGMVIDRELQGVPERGKPPRNEIKELLCLTSSSAVSAAHCLSLSRFSVDVVLCRCCAGRAW